MQAASTSAGCRTGRLLGKLTPTPEGFTRLIGMMPSAIWHGYTGRRTAGSAAHTALQNRVKALESEVKAYVDLHRAELDGKSRALNFGTVGYRVSSKLMLASSRVAEAIATLKVLGHTELIKTTETLDREALKRQPGDILQQVGAYIRTVDEFYFDVSSKEADA